MMPDKSRSAEPSPDDASAGSAGVQPASVEPASAEPAPAEHAPAERAAPPARPPEQTSDDTDVGWGEAPEPGDAHDRWLLEQRPPHWD